MNAYQALQSLKPFINQGQLRRLAELVRNSEEREFFRAKVMELVNLIETMPRPYQQDGLGDEAIVYLHYFHGSADFHITERDSTEEQHQAFGRANIGYGAELGYISIQELIENQVELDLHWTPKPLKDCKGA
jgi:hypothetical protein